MTMNSHAQLSPARRIFVSQSPFFDPKLGYLAWKGIWPASWIDHPERPRQAPSVALFRRRWSMAAPATVRIHVSADNRYRLFLDGRPVGRGPERGSPERWRYESYELELPACEHVLLAQTWWLGDDVAPWAQMSVRPGFLLAAEGEWKDILGTGLSMWESCLTTGIEFPRIPAVLGWVAVGNRWRIDGRAFPWGFENGATGKWAPAQAVAQAFSGDQRDSNRWWVLSPATLPPMLEKERAAGRLRHLSARREDAPVLAADNLVQESAAWQAWLEGKGAVTIPPRATRRAIVDIGDYCCAYPLLTVSGGLGARIRIDWAESLFAQEDRPKEPLTGAATRTKGNRDEIEGRWFTGFGDEFLPDGEARREFTTLWWDAGRYIQVTVETGDAPLTLDAFRLLETRYPLEMDGRWTSSEPRLEGVIPLGVRALQMCSHETYMDCPYYEQLMYVGDTRLEVLTTYALTRDDRLPRKAVQTFADSRRLSGFTRSAFPSHTLQLIPPFSLWWVCMAHDYWMWRDTEGWTRGVLPAARTVMDAFRNLLRPDGLLAAPPEWNFVDWVPEWSTGIPPGADFNPSGVIQLQSVLSFLAKAEMEAGFGEAELAARDRAAAESLMAALRRSFWSPARRLFADNPEQTLFSEHVQCLAILTGLLSIDEERALGAVLIEGSGDLAKTTIYFTHYLFEALRRLGRGDLIPGRMALWYGLVERGLRTTVESPEPARSDCHAWGAHPLFHYYATLLGIRPSAPGFRRVRIAPQPGGLAYVEGELPHPAGFIRVALRRTNSTMVAEIELPGELSGEFVWNGRTAPLNPGKTTLKM
jgi:hypothetical protein